MAWFLGKRLVSRVLLVFTISISAFLLIAGSTDTVARNLLGESATAAQLSQKQAELRLDQPLVTRYFQWFIAAVQGDFGTSWFSGEPVADMLAARLPVTLSIVAVALVVTTILSAVLGIAAAARGGWLDRTIQTVSMLGFGLPGFWIALMLVFGFAIALPVLPATGYVPFTENPMGWVAATILPVTALVIGSIATSAQQVRGAMIDVLRRDYIRTLRARGLSSTSVLYRHALRNAAPSALTVLSLQFVSLLGGTAVIEKIFAIPGIGVLTVNSANLGDVPVLMGIVPTMVLIVVIVTLIADLVAGWIDPKARMR